MDVTHSKPCTSHLQSLSPSVSLGGIDSEKVLTWNLNYAYGRDAMNGRDTRKNPWICQCRTLLGIADVTAAFGERLSQQVMTISTMM
jgi:hypothetical protein